MGFMDKMKGMAQSAASGGVTDAGEYRERAMKINESGVDTPATIKSMTPTGKTDFGGGKEIVFEVEVTPAGGAPYTATFNQSMVDSVLSGLSVGQAITVRVDPNDPNSMLFWGMAS